MLLILVQSTLLILTLLSFIPQLRLIWLRENCSGISIIYVLLNLVSATEHFTINLAVLVVPVSEEDGLINDPLTVGDWLNLCQNSLVLMMFIIYFAMCLYFRSDYSTEAKRLALGIYMAFLLISIVPLASDAINSAQDNQNDADAWLSTIVLNIHRSYVCYVVTWLIFVAAFAQDITILDQPPSSSPCASLSRIGLAMQAVVFPLLAISWMYRVPLSLNDTLSRNLPGLWYERVGWATIDNAVFGLGQANILRLVVRERMRSGFSASLKDTEPLLRSEV